MSLIDKYNEMVEESGQTKHAEAQQEQDGTEEVFAKYANWAAETLQSEYGDQFTEEDVEKLAQAKIDQDYEESVQREKVAEAFELGQIMFQGWKHAAEEDE